MTISIKQHNGTQPASYDFGNFLHSLMLLMKGRIMLGSEGLSNVRLLLVEDDEMIRDALKIVFKKKGCKVQVYESAEEGLDAIKKDNYDVIISDFRLPGIDGLEFLKQALKIQPGAIRTLVTAYRDYGLSKDAYQAGVHLFYEKPFSLKTVTLALVDILHGREENGGRPMTAGQAQITTDRLNYKVNA